LSFFLSPLLINPIIGSSADKFGSLYFFFSVLYLDLIDPPEEKRFEASLGDY
jgi:hypothetical protein